MGLTIVSEPSVLRTDESGTVRVGATRVTLATLVAAFQSGATPEQMAQDYPTLKLADIYSAVGYYLNHRQQIDDYLGRQEQGADDFRRNNPKLYAQGVRDRLVARSSKQPGT